MEKLKINPCARSVNDFFCITAARMLEIADKVASAMTTTSLSEDGSNKMLLTLIVDIPQSPEETAFTFYITGVMSEKHREKIEGGSNPLSILLAALSKPRR